MIYEAAIYRASDNTERDRWAVFNTRSHTWTFPSRYGKKAAEKLAARLNKEAS